MKYVYMLRVGEQHYKIGIAINVAKRMSSIKTSNAYPVEVVTAKLATKAALVEQEIHRRLAAMRADGGTEWFKLTPEQALDIACAINAECDVEANGQLSIEALSQSQRTWQKSIDRKLDMIVNAYQLAKPVREPEPERPKLSPEQSYAEVLEQARAIVLTEQKASTSLLQRRMSIGYGRAARIIDQLEQEGFISPGDGNRSRKVLIPDVEKLPREDFEPEPEVALLRTHSL